MELKMQPKVYANSRSRGVPGLQRPTRNIHRSFKRRFAITKTDPTSTLTFKALSIRTLCMLNGGLNMVTYCEIFANLRLEL